MNADPVRTPYGATTTADEVIAGIDLTGRRAIVTGSTSGIGLETARALASAGAEVTLAVRNVGVGRGVARQISEETANPHVDVAGLELADRRSVRSFVAGWRGPLHVLVNNAGIMATPLRRTAEGWESQFAINHLGHFGVTTGLHDALAAEGARVVNVSSVGHITGEVLFDDPNFEQHPYDPWAAYSQSKTANILFAVGIARRWSDNGITANALNPGRITATGLVKHVDPDAVPTGPTPGQDSGVSVKDIPQGAATSVLLAASPLLDGVSGRYFEDCQEAWPVRPGIRRGVAPYALDPQQADRLWELSEQLLKTPLP
ncbi:oxidoreductase [Microlunatus endophyticus]|uniref:Probable oxidoreductase n=1 Tax=Microlunatus endophyticus TaxID=1716077 RepID=A0A917W7N9_9ACTN|nr:SDR family NAD(P)-dependent oxidoreductase [Microlunatus endophyticus]GGL80454.1 oxidoreductase [Microlunatus endophyticus]